jgi:hypothetical protein
MKKIILFLMVLFSAMWIGSAVDAAIIVGRISNVEGQINRYMAVDDSWVATSLQSPAGTQDILATGDDSKAEITFPNNQLVRLDENTEIEILNLDDDIGEFGLYSGLARFYNRSSVGKVLIETAMGTATVEPGSAIDVLVDKKSVTVSAVHGEAIFHSFQDGVEREEAISGSTSLEFREKSIIAGNGPIERKWDRWCADREGVLAQNRLVRSEHLPESMQEYAYAVEPYGRWQRIYYRGYNYWAWKPYSVTAGWSPYTTGYWEDWQGSSVWVDYNPWGWTTHHHGHWLNMHGAWLWTPYVHVANVPGVTAIGFNITFGKRYRSVWHPGRVRWIAHNDNVGWLPLAPWETYYGYRKWGARIVVVRGGTSFSINLNLSNHKHIKHAVIIPKHQLYRRKPGTIHNYNTAKIKNINKMTIVKNYKLLPSAHRLRERKHSTEIARNRNTDRRIKIRRDWNAKKTKKITRSENQGLKRGRIILAQPNKQKERREENKYENGHRRAIEKKYSGGIDNHRVATLDKTSQERVVKSEQRPRQITVEKEKSSTVKSRGLASDKVRKTLAKGDKSPKRSNGVRQAQVDRSSKRSQKQKIETFVAGKKGEDDRQHIHKENSPTQWQVAKNSGGHRYSASLNNSRFR